VTPTNVKRLPDEVKDVALAAAVERQNAFGPEDIAGQLFERC
jgi:hypothetical protein